MIKEDCIFCKIAKGDIPSATVYETSDFRVIMDITPANEGHVLIITKEHYDDIFQIDGETAGKLFSLATIVARAIKDELGCDGLNVVQNNREAAGQTVKHFHLHLIPRYIDDGISLAWSQKETDKERLAELAKLIKKRI